MKNREKPVFKLTIVFILAVFISAGILTYLSISNISNLKELTEKKVQEEEAELAQWFLDLTQDKIDEISAIFVSLKESDNLNPETLLFTEQNSRLIKHPFILDSVGNFIFPNFNETLSEPVLIAKSNFQELYKKGETSEFLKSDFSSAARYYRLALKAGKSQNEKAQAINALGRVDVKRNKFNTAFESYKSVVLEYYQESDRNGFPVVYYAINQLINTSQNANADSLLMIFNTFLLKMKNGQIPLNLVTSEIIQQINVWLEKNTFSTQKDKTEAKTLISEIEKQTAFISEFGHNIKMLMLNNSKNPGYTESNGFIPFHVPDSEKYQTVLINSKNQNPVGFLIDKLILFDSIVTSLPETEFDYRITFSELENRMNNKSELQFISRLNPWFPFNRIEIVPANENLIREYVVRRAWIYGILILLLLAGMTMGVILILRDINREKRLTRLQSDFISNVTHELKTPLTSISMFTESMLLKRIKNDSDKDEYLSIILKESDRLKRMINNILEFSKLEKGKSDYRFIKTNLASILKAAIGELDYWFQKEGFEVVAELDDQVSTKVDSEKMKQVFENLLNNAIKYSPQTKKITTRLYANTDKIHIEIEDRGIGIPENELSQIFEKFYRINHKESISGTGLGLTVVKEIVEAHGGEIKVTSEPGKGSKFSIILNRQTELE